MTDRQQNRAFPLVIAVAMVLSLLLTSLGHTATHGQAAPAHTQGVHHDVLAPEVTSHGYSHDAGWPGQRHAGTAHGHHAADHSHEIPAPAEIAALTVVRTGDRLHAFLPNSPPQGPSFRIERPPRS
jgi:hypothetical protein